MYKPLKCLSNSWESAALLFGNSKSGGVFKETKRYSRVHSIFRSRYQIVTIYKWLYRGEDSQIAKTEDINSSSCITFVVSLSALVLMQWNLDYLSKTVLSSILAYAAKFSFKDLGPAVGSTEICHFLSPCPGFCACTRTDHMIKLILKVLLIKTWDFVP